MNDRLLGEIRMLAPNYIKEIWSACESCGKARWVQVIRGKPRNPRCRACSKRGPRNQTWVGGKLYKNSKYILTRISPDNPFYSMAHERGYIQVHRLVMAQHLGRCLKQGEDVHHVNGDTLDNRLENLEVVHHREHSQTHAEGYKKGYEDGKCDSNKEWVEFIKQECDEIRDPDNKEALVYYGIKPEQLEALKRGGVEQK